jgi:hypothetical protein
MGDIYSLLRFLVNNMDNIILYLTYKTETLDRYLT